MPCRSPFAPWRPPTPTTGGAARRSPAPRPNRRTRAGGKPIRVEGRSDLSPRRGGRHSAPRGTYMPIRVLFASIFGLLLGEPAAAQVLPIPPGWQMDRAILLSRHGVRAPVKSNEEMDQHVATPRPG